MNENAPGLELVARSAARLAAALDALEDALGAPGDAAPAKREIEIMAEDRARMADEMEALAAENEGLRESGARAVADIRRASGAVRAALDEPA